MTEACSIHLLIVTVNKAPLNYEYKGFFQGGKNHYKIINVLAAIECKERYCLLYTYMVRNTSIHIYNRIYAVTYILKIHTFTTRILV